MTHLGMTHGMARAACVSVVCVACTWHWRVCFTSGMALAWYIICSVHKRPTASRTNAQQRACNMGPFILPPPPSWTMADTVQDIPEDDSSGPGPDAQPPEASPAGLPGEEAPQHPAALPGEDHPAPLPAEEAPQHPVQLPGEDHPAALPGEEAAKPPAQEDHPAALPDQEAAKPPAQEDHPDKDLENKLQSMAQDAVASALASGASVTPNAEAVTVLTAGRAKLKLALEEALKDDSDVGSRGALAQKMKRELTSEEMKAYKDKSNHEKSEFRRLWAKQKLAEITVVKEQLLYI